MFLAVTEWTGDGPLNGFDQNIVYGVLAALAAAALYSAYLGARAKSASAGVGLALLAVILAGALGFAGQGVRAAFAGAALGVLIAAGFQLFFHTRKEAGWWVAGIGLGSGLVFIALGAPIGAFVLAAFVTVFGGLKVVETDEPIHATVWLALSLVGVAGAFLTAGAQFIALIQLLVYVGAIITLFLFTIMLTIPVEDANFLDELELPPGITIESVEELEGMDPSRGQGPMKPFDNPKKPLKVPATLYGVSIDDGVYGTETTDRTPKEKPKKGGQ